MNESERSAANASVSNADGFQVLRQPVVKPGGAARDRAIPDDLPASYGVDLLYVIPRDPGTLFLYWDVNWTRLFEQAGLSPRQVHLRIYREDGSVEGTREINPFRGHCYVDVAAGGTAYFCELGCFDGNEWTKLVRSGTTATPEAVMSDDFSAEFATLPLHLSFQRLLEVFETNNGGGKSLAHSVSQLQENAHAEAAPGSGKGGNGKHGAEITSLLEAAREAATRGTLTPEQQAKWQELSERLSGSGWGGASESGLGGSSPA